MSRSLLAAALIAAPCAVLGCAAQPPDDVVVIETEIPSESIASPSLAQIEAMNRAPCGDRTIAVITTGDNDQYALCTGPRGAVGVLESQWNPAPERSRLDRNPLPADLVAELLGPDDPARLPILTAIATGVAPATPIVIGARDQRVPQLAGSCNDDIFHDDQCETNSYSPFDQFAGIFVDTNGSDQRNLDCGSWSAFCHLGWGHHIRYATGYQADGLGETGSAPWLGACATKEWLTSCGGSTLFQGSVRPGDSGSWDLVTSWWVQSGSSVVWVWYANAEHLCRGDTDRDDHKVDGWSEPGANHNAALIFMKKVTGLYGCDPE